MIGEEVKRWRRAKKALAENPGPYKAINLQVAERELKEAVRASLTLIEGGKSCPDTHSTSRQTGYSTD